MTRQKKFHKVLDKVKLRTWVSLGLITILTPLIFAAVYGVFGALGGSNVAPVAHWSFDEGTNNTCSGGSNDACDSSGNGNDGAFGATTAAPSWQTEDKCVSGKCLYFDGSDDYITIPSSSSLRPTNITVTAWIRPNSTTSDQWGVVIGHPYDDEASWNEPYFSWDIVRHDANDGARWQITTSGPTLNFNETGLIWNQTSWQFLAMTYDGDTMRGYVNGVLLFTNTNPSGDIVYDASFPNVMIGQRSIDSPDEYYGGFMDEIKVFNTALTADQVKAEYAGGAAVLGAQDTSFLNDGLVGYWPMDDNDIDSHACATGSTVAGVCDFSGNNNHAVANGTLADADFEAGVFGYSINMNGEPNDEFLQAADHSTLDITDEITIAVWNYHEDGDDEENLVAKRSTGAGNANYALKSGPWNTLDNRLEFVFNDPDTGPAYRSDNDVIIQNKWQHLAVSFKFGDANSIRLFVDGEIVPGSWVRGTGAESTSANNNGLVIGGFWKTGNFDDIRIYNRTFSPSEIKALYNWAPGPYAYYNFDEGSGTTLYDRSGNGNNSSSFSGSPTWTTGKFGNALNFNGSSDYITISNESNFDFQHSITVEAWVLAEWDLTWQSIITKGDSSWRLSRSGNSNFLSWTQDGLSDTSCDGSTHINDGQWHHVTGTYDATTGIRKIYVDGISECHETGITGTITTNNFSVLIGENAQSTGRYFQGKIDEVKIYNYARTAQQVLEDLNAGHPVGGSPVGSHMSYWKLDEMTGTTAYDNSNQNNDLTLNSASWALSGKYNGAWNGTGANWLSINDDGDNNDFDISATDNYSLSVWFKSDSASNPGGDEYIVSKASGSLQGYGIYVTSGGLVCFGIDDDTSWGPDVASCTSSDFYDNAWHHIVAVRDHTRLDQIRIYVDGVLRDSDTDTTTASLANDTSDFLLGDRTGTDDGNEFNGDIDEVKIYRSTLTLEQALILYNASSAANFGVGTNEKSTTYGGPGGNDPVMQWKLDSNTGTSAIDTSGNENTGTLTNSPTWTTGKFGSAVSFAGSNQHITRADDSDLDFAASSSFTITTWFKHGTASATETLVSKLESSGTDGGYKLKMESDGDITCETDDDDADTTIDDTATTTAATYDDDAWHHVACVYDTTNTDLLIYIDGVLSASDTTTTTNSLANDDAFFYGIESATGTEDWIGQLDQLKVFNYALSQSQVTYDYNRGEPIGWWKLDDNVSGNGQTVYDNSKNANGDAGGNNGTTSDGGATLDCTVSGKRNLGCDLDGTDDYIDLNSTLNNALQNNSFTVAAWIKRDSTSRYDPIFSNTAAASNENIFLFIDNDDSVSCDFFNNGVDSTITVTDTNWHHVACSYDASSNARNVYLDGAVVASDTSAADFSGSNEFHIGHFDSAGTFFDGRIDDVRVYTYPLSSAQMRNVMNDGAAYRWGPSEGSP